ncbi:monooxygenase, partial [Mycobacterium tuberculosis]
GTGGGPDGDGGAADGARSETQAHHSSRGRKRARRTGATRSEGTEEANAREGAEGRRRRHRQGGGQDRGRRANS